MSQPLPNDRKVKLLEDALVRLSARSGAAQAAINELKGQV